jgi:TPP-dependent 2-oxoacid decarboxylase
MFCSTSKQEQPANHDLENQAADELANKIVEKLRSVNRPIVIGDFYAQRFGFGEEMRGLCGALGIRYFGSEFSSILGMFREGDPDRRVISFRSQSRQVSLPSRLQLD